MIDERDTIRQENPLDPRFPDLNNDIKKKIQEHQKKQNGRTTSLPVNLDPKISELPLKAEITTLFSLKIKVSVLTLKSLIVQMPWLTTGKQ